MDNLNFTATEILNTSLACANKFFPGQDEERIKKQYKKLASLWHPDKHIKDSINSEEVFKHIKELYEEALKKLNLGISDNIIKFYTMDGKTFELRFLKEDSFELGVSYISNTHIAYCFKKEFKDFYQNYIKNIHSFHFANEKMENEIKKTLPTIVSQFETDEYFVVIIKKDKNLIQLKDILHYYNNQLDARHVAWIINSLYNIACYLNYAGICHQNISIDNYFIDPNNHYGALLGGWAYSMPNKNKLIGLPKKSLDLCSPIILKDKKANFILDLESIKQIARELLGDKSGIFFNTTLPKPLIQWSKISSHDNAINEYKNFNQVLNQVFGKRKYFKMDATSEKIYKS